MFDIQFKPPSPVSSEEKKDVQTKKEKHMLQTT